MTQVKPVESLTLALWKSAATEVMAERLGLSGTAGGIDADHPILAGVDRYSEAVARGEKIPPPKRGKTLRDDDPAVAAYLAQLHHGLGHARGVGDAKLEAEIKDQLAAFKFGNPPWQQMSQQYYKYYAQYPYHTGGRPRYRAWNAFDGGKGNPDYSVIEWRLPADATVALVGDIGTGTDIAAAVLVAALSFKPDAILHVGDVYYSGTRFEFAHRFIGLFETVMAAQGLRVPVFTVPGNHEYFTGNLAFFEYLDNGKLAPLPGQRQAASYFALMSADDGWQFLGMDTGYYGHYFAVSAEQQRAELALLHQRDPKVPLNLPIQQLPLPVDMAILRDDEAQWQSRRIESFAGQSVLLSHHPLYSAAIDCGIAQRTTPGADGKPVPVASDTNRLWVDTGIWRQLGRYFGARVPAWFWGHEHNLNIFRNDYRPADWPDDPDTAKIFRTLPLGRCIGHSAIPVNETEGPYAQKYPVPLKSPELRLGLTDGWYNHGFEIVKLAGSGRPAHVSYYQIVGVDPRPLLMHEEDFGGETGR